MKRGLIALMVVILTLTAAGPALGYYPIDRKTNRYRVAHELRRLPVSPVLQRLARQRVREIPWAFEHDFWWGPLSRCSRGWGENIAYRNPPPANPGRWFFRAWRDSRPHRRVMLGRWNAMASAIWTAPNGGMYGVQLYGLGCRW